VEGHTASRGGNGETKPLAEDGLIRCFQLILFAGMVKIVREQYHPRFAD